MAATAGLAMDANRASERASFVVIVIRVCRGLFFVRFLEDEEGLFLHALVGDEALAVEVVLKAGVDAAGGAEVHQEPGAGAAELRDFVEHRDLVVVDLGLVLLGPEGGVGVAGGGVVAGFGVAAPLGHDEGFLVANVPGSGVGAFGVLLVPADVLVGADDVEGFAQRVVDDLVGAGPSGFFSVRTSSAAVTRRVGSSWRARSAMVVRYLVRASVLGVSLATDQRMMEALLRSRRIISVSCCLDLARTAGLSNWRAQ